MNAVVGRHCGPLWGRSRLAVRPSMTHSATLPTTSAIDDRVRKCPPHCQSRMGDGAALRVAANRPERTAFSPDCRFKHLA